MDRKIKHLDKPIHQRWLYRLADMGLVRSISLIWAASWLAIGVAIVIVKVIIKFTK